MPVQVTLNRFAGGQFIDTKTKSNVNILSYYCDDLLGCGTPTHTRFSQSAQFNALENCKIVPIFLASMSGIVKAEGSYNPGSFLGALMSFIQSADDDSTAVYRGNPASFGDSLTWSDKGTYFETEVESNIFQLGIARESVLVDQCNIPYLSRISASVNVLGRDANCSISLVYQGSITVAKAIGPNAINTIGIGEMGKMTSLWEIAGLQTVLGAVTLPDGGFAANCPLVPAAALNAQITEYGTPVNKTFQFGLENP